MQHIIKDEEIEARELQKILKEVGKSLRKNSIKKKKGLTFAEFKAQLLKKLNLKAPLASDASH